MWTTRGLLLWAFTQQTSPPLDVNMRMHMLRQHVELGHVSTPFCPTFDMVADYMTKATPKPTHERHNARTMGSQSLAPPLTLIQHLID